MDIWHGSNKLKCPLITITPHYVDSYRYVHLSSSIYFVDSPWLLWINPKYWAIMDIHPDISLTTIIPNILGVLYIYIIPHFPILSHNNNGSSLYIIPFIYIHNGSSHNNRPISCTQAERLGGAEVAAGGGAEAIAHLGRLDAAGTAGTIYIYIYVYIHIYIYMCVCMYMCIHIYICMYVCIYIYIYVYVYMYMYMCICMCICICICICIYWCACLCMNVYVYMLRYWFLNT